MTVTEITTSEPTGEITEEAASVASHPLFTILVPSDQEVLKGLASYGCTPRNNDWARAQISEARKVLDYQAGRLLHALGLRKQIWHSDHFALLPADLQKVVGISTPPTDTNFIVALQGLIDELYKAYDELTRIRKREEAALRATGIADVQVKPNGGKRGGRPADKRAADAKFRVE